jgi:hypothetical protein
MQLAENFQANWQVENCFMMTMLDPTQPEQPRGEFKNCSENFLNIRLTARVGNLVTSISLVLSKIIFVVKVSLMKKRGVRKWLTQQSKDFYAAGFDALAKRCNKCLYG